MLDLLSDDVRRHPYPLYARLRTESPLLQAQAGVWMVFRLRARPARADGAGDVRLAGGAAGRAAARLAHLPGPAATFEASRARPARVHAARDRRHGVAHPRARNRARRRRDGGRADGRRRRSRGAAADDGHRGDARHPARGSAAVPGVERGRARAERHRVLRRWGRRARGRDVPRRDGRDARVRRSRRPLAPGRADRRPLVAARPRGGRRRAARRRRHPRPLPAPARRRQRNDDEPGR